ncbi:DUF2651 family protein [Desmospora profundinema]|uniref:Membrane protein n=1 Tax=Desmospora profundinema TaxID=1571184 RepID=A0ABU1IN08_9BACL|nr:DUF2651 family protein [Desmospora profundinema]MDR6226170.1 putative membrane protein [Desmospora profundinema]
MHIEAGTILVDFPLYSLLAGMIFQIWPKRLWVGPLLVFLFQTYMVYYFQDLEWFMWVGINTILSFLGAFMVYGIQQLMKRIKKRDPK